jgi:nanoRNase/pAp phosphatase (c-di-AMP/oligoRNAs hydrolase)
MRSTMVEAKTSRNAKRTKARLQSSRDRIRVLWDLFQPSDNVLILINPDPDSMASSLALKRLLWKRIQKTLIAYIGEIQRLENQAMMELLQIPMVRINQVDLEFFNRFVVVDSQPHHYEVFSKFEFDVIIDHHPRVEKWNHVAYVDIRPEYGATATILIEYLRAAGIKPSMKLATALFYAIKTDTANFERDATEADVKQFRYIFRYANMNLLRKIEWSELRLSELQYFRVALEKMVVTRKGIYAHVGEVENPDICVQIADFFMRIHGMGWSFVSGIYRGKLIVIFRSDGFRKDAGKLAVRAFGGLGHAGGHRGAARAEITLETLREKGIEAQDTALSRFVRSRLDA